MEITMPPWILAAVAAAIPILLTVLAIASLVGPFVIPLWASTLDEKRRLQLVAAVKGANDALGPIVRMTPTDLDDRIAAVLVMVELELGKAKGKVEVIKREAITSAIVAKSARPPSVPAGLTGSNVLGRGGPEARVR